MALHPDTRLPCSKEASIDHLSALLGSHRFRFTDEKGLQDAIALLLERASLPFEREVTLARGDVIDFLVADSIGLEVKIKGSVSGVTRQLVRYAEHSRIRYLILFTTLARLDNFPATLRDKPLRVVVYRRALV